jgi:glutathione synthase
MPLTVAMQMDPMEGLNIAGDSSFAIMVAAQARGHRVYHYRPNDLSWRDGRLWTQARSVTVQPKAGDHFQFGENARLDLGRDVDVVWMRQDPPFDLNYITATHLLERITHETLVLNDPDSVRNAPEKLFVLDYARFMPPTMITRSLEETRAFLTEHREIVVKPLYGNAGSAVFRIGEDGANLAALVELFNDRWVEPFMVQAFLRDVAKGDKRIVLIDGDVAGAINRIPGKGEIRSNLAAGGSAEQTELTETELEICAAMGPELRARGLLFVGIDVIGGRWLTEINVTSPTGIVAMDRFNGTDTPARIWDAVERRLIARASAR